MRTLPNVVTGWRACAADTRRHSRPEPCTRRSGPPVSRLLCVQAGKGFTIIEILVVVGIIAVLASLLFPALLAHLEGARIEETRAQLRIIEAALSQYQNQFGDYPPSYGEGDNPGAESLLAALCTTENGGPFLKEREARRWAGDADGDGRKELVDPWKNPWIYFHNSDYTQGEVYYTFKGRRWQVKPVKSGGAFLNLTSYQLWACGPNKTDEAGAGDDVGNVAQ